MAQNDTQPALQMLVHIIIPTKYAKYTATMTATNSTKSRKPPTVYHAYCETAFRNCSYFTKTFLLKRT